MNEPPHFLTPSAPAPIAAPLDGGLITADLPCSRCAYNLRGLTPEARCPECGTPVAQSLYGNWLRLANPDWLRKLRLGAALKLWALLVGLLIGAGSALTMMAGLPPAIFLLLGIASGIFGLAAVFLITSQEPTVGKAEDPITLRKTVRVCAVVGFAGGQFAPGLAPWITPPWIIVTGHVLSIAGIVAMFGEFVYLRRFARRIPNEKLAKRTSIVMWGFGAAMITFVAIGILSAVFLAFPTQVPVPASMTTATTGTTVITSVAVNPVPGPGNMAFGAIGFLGCFAGLAFLVFGVLYISLLFRYYGAFKRALAEAEQIARGDLPPIPLSIPAPAPLATPPPIPRS